MTELKDRLKQIRVLRGFTQPSLAEASGVPQSTISNIETGETKDSKYLIVLANFFNVDYDAFLTGEGWDAQLTSESTDNTIDRILKLSDNLDDETVMRLMGLLASRRAGK